MQQHCRLRSLFIGWMLFSSVRRRIKGQTITTCEFMIPQTRQKAGGKQITTSSNLREKKFSYLQHKQMTLTFRNRAAGTITNKLVFSTAQYGSTLLNSFFIMDHQQLLIFSSPQSRFWWWENMQTADLLHDARPQNILHKLGNNLRATVTATFDSLKYFIHFIPIFTPHNILNHQWIYNVVKWPPGTFIIIY